jgi:endo-1,3(4)-beta-glucanase
MGHSWAAGLQPSFDGKNQESSSEAVSAYYGVALLGKATGNAELEGWGRLMLATEIRAARKYTQVYSGNDLYQQVLKTLTWAGRDHLRIKPGLGAVS